MDLQTIVLVLAIIILSIILLAILAAIAGLLMLRKKVRRSGFAKVGSILTLVQLGRRFITHKR